MKEHKLTNCLYEYVNSKNIISINGLRVFSKERTTLANKLKEMPLKIGRAICPVCDIKISNRAFGQ